MDPRSVFLGRSRKADAVVDKTLHQFLSTGNRLSFRHHPGNCIFWVRFCFASLDVDDRPRVMRTLLSQPDRLLEVGNTRIEERRPYRYVRWRTDYPLHCAEGLRDFSTFREHEHESRE